MNEKKRKVRREDGIGNVLKRLQSTRESVDSIDSDASAASSSPAVTTTDTTLEIVVLIGISCSGKTTFARHFFPHHAKVSRKHLRARRTGASRDDKLVRVLARHLSAHRSVVLDAAHASRRTRLRALESIQLARPASVALRVVGYVFAIHVPRFVARNRRRAAFDASVRTAPDAVILRDARVFEWPASNETGFDELHFVTTVDDDDDASASADFRFVVSPFLGPQLAAASSILLLQDRLVDS